MKRNLWFVLASLVVFSLIAAQCGGAATEAPPEPAATEAPLSLPPPRRRLSRNPPSHQPKNRPSLHLKLPK